MLTQAYTKMKNYFNNLTRTEKDAKKIQNGSSQRQLSRKVSLESSLKNKARSFISSLWDFQVNTLMICALPI
jgi:hypothetical protein